MIVSVAAEDVASIQPTTAQIRTTQQGVGRRETLVLPGKGLRWKHRFTGQQIITPPRLHYRLVTEVAYAVDTLEHYKEFKKHVRPSLSTDATVALNNTPLAVTNQRLLHHTDEGYSEDRVRPYPKGVLSNQGEATTRQMAPVRTYTKQYGLKDESNFIPVVGVHNPGAVINNLDFEVFVGMRKFGHVQITLGSGELEFFPVTENPLVSPYDISQKATINFNEDVILVHIGLPNRFLQVSGQNLPDWGTVDVHNHYVPPTNFDWALVHDVYEDIDHPYFKSPKSNVLYMDVNLSQPTVEVGPLFHNEGTHYSTKLLETDTPFDSGGHNTILQGLTPTLTFDQVTPTLPIPPHSISMLHSYVETVRAAPLGRALTADTSEPGKVLVGPIHSEQVPDLIYVFVKGEGGRASNPLAVILSIRFKTPQGTDMVSMDQETLYRMSVRNGCKQSRTEFMCSKGSLVMINPEVDLGGYVNGVLLKHEFSIEIEYEQAYRNGSSIINKSDLQDQLQGTLENTKTYNAYVVQKQLRRLVLNGDGTGQMTSSMIQPAEVVREKMYHPSLIPPGTQEIDGGVLGQL